MMGSKQARYQKASTKDEETVAGDVLVSKEDVPRRCPLWKKILLMSVSAMLVVKFVGHVVFHHVGRNGGYRVVDVEEYNRWNEEEDEHHHRFFWHHHHHHDEHHRHDHFRHDHDHDEHHHHHHHHEHHHEHFHHDAHLFPHVNPFELEDIGENFPDIFSAGEDFVPPGFGWTLNDDGTISPSANPELALGRAPRPVLKLVKKGSPSQLIFDQLSTLKKDDDGGHHHCPFHKPKTAAMTATTASGAPTGVRRLLQNSTFHVGPWRVDGAQVGNSQTVNVSYIHDNFLRAAGRENLVLDVNMWKFVEGNTVNFVGGSGFFHPTFLKGGGRDWDINDDGTVSPKMDSSLVLGVGHAVLVLVDRKAQNPLQFDDLSALLKDGGAPLAPADNPNLAVGNLFPFTLPGPDGLHFVLTSFVPTAQASNFQLFKKTFLADVNQKMALHVPHGRYAKGTPVMLVGKRDADE